MNTRVTPIAAALALVVSGCADEVGSVQMTEICAMPTAGCTFSDKCGQTLLGDVVLDVAQQDRLWLVVQVENQRTSSADATAGRTNTANAFLQSYDSEYTVVAVPSPGTPSTVSAPATSGLVIGTVPAGGSTTAAVQPITPALGAALVAQVPTSTPTAPQYVDLVAHLRLKGVYADNASFTTTRYDIPVRVCKGCLTPVVCPAGVVMTTCPPDSPGQIPSTVSCGTGP